MEDQKILALLWDRAQSALDALSRKFGKGLYRLAYNILGSHADAEETVNDTYLALWNTIPPQRPEPLSAYIYKVGKHTALKRYRHNTAQKRNGHYDLCLEELSGVLAGTSLEEDFDAILLGQTIDRFLDGLDTQNRRIFLRRYWFGDRVTELAKAERLSANALSVRLSRLRQQLKDYLIKEGFAP